MATSSSSFLSDWAPWVLLGTVLTGFIGYLVLQVQNLKRISSQNEKILQLLMETQKKEPEEIEETGVDETTMIQVQENLNDVVLEDDLSSESELSSEYQLPYFEDTEEEEEEEQMTMEFKRTSSESENGGAGTGSSGYNTEQEIDYEWECYKILRAPLGPVPHDQILLCFTCQISEFYVKAIVDGNHNAVWIMTYKKNENQEWNWMETICSTCIQRVRDVLADGGCPIPFAIDLEQETIQHQDTSEGVEESEEEDVIEKPIQTFPTEGFIIMQPEFEYDSDAQLFE